MADDYYKEALKLAQKEYHHCVAHGMSPCLPVLDDFLPSEKSTMGIELGLVQIPAEFIVGTKTRGRVNAFAPNFMPMLEEGTEFSDKWKRLCEAHLTEGIRDPIKVYEYMNRYYVEEGNKRVSVLKYFDALTIAANVTRIMPEKSDAEDVELYYEFVAFNKVSGINFLEFSKKGSFAEMQKALGKEPNEEWDEDEQKEFSAIYYYFRKAYNQNGGEKLASTVGDAMLTYIKVYGYEELKNTDISDIKKNLNRMWEEVKLQDDEEPIEIKTDPSEEKKPSMFSWILPLAIPIPQQVLKVAFLYDGTPERSGWTNEHEEGRLHINDVFGEKIETSAYSNAMDNPSEVMAKAIENGNKVIFATSPRLVQASLRAAVEHPDVVIMNCSLNKSHRYIRSYYTRMYEVKFILGAIAGSLSETGKLGYVGDYPIYGQIAGINAFALGAQMVNRRAKVQLEWAGVKGAHEAAQALYERGVHIISSHDTAPFRKDKRSNYGLSYIYKGENEMLAIPVWKWGVYYEELLKRIFDRTVKEEYKNSSKALNYYWGMSAGVVDIEYSNSLPVPTRKLADLLKEGIIQDIISPFVTPFTTQDGRIIGEDVKALNLEQIISMDYLVDNVEGTIPRYEELTPMGKATVDTAGIEKSQDNASEEAEE